MDFTRQRHRQNRGAPSPGFPAAGGSRFSDRENLGRSLREQIEAAVVVQQSLLPDVSGAFGGFRLAAEYLPCESLAGDFYDICRRPGCVTLMVSDVMGHGVEAALLTPVLKTVFQEAAPWTSDPGALLKEMNERLHGLIPAGTFAATTVARLDPRTSEVLLANSGQPYPVVLRASNQGVDVICATGVPLGLFKNGDSYEYAVHRLDLAPGDVLLMASDGIGSIEDGTGRCFEDHQLFRALSDLSGFSGERVLKSLVAEAIEFSNGLPFPDDISMVAVTRDRQSQEQ